MKSVIRILLCGLIHLKKVGMVEIQVSQVREKAGQGRGGGR